MSLHTAILVNGILDLAIILAVTPTMLFPVTLDRGRHEATLYAFAAPLPDGLAA